MIETGENSKQNLLYCRILCHVHFTWRGTDIYYLWLVVYIHNFTLSATLVRRRKFNFRWRGPPDSSVFPNPSWLVWGRASRHQKLAPTFPRIDSCLMVTWSLGSWIEVWEGQSVWWWDGCVGCPWKTESAVRIYATFLVLIVLLMWWGVEDWDGLDIWSVRVWMIGCLLAEGWW